MDRYTYLKVHGGDRIVWVAVIMAEGVNPDGRREVLGMKIGTSEAEAIWTEFLRVRLLEFGGILGQKIANSSDRLHLLARNLATTIF
jgi:putative transposase